MIKIQNSTRTSIQIHKTKSATKLDTLKTHLREFSRQELDESSAFERDELIDAATGTRVQKMPVAGKRVWHMFIITVFRHHETPGCRLHSFTALLIRLYTYGSKISNNSGLVQRAAATLTLVRTCTSSPYRCAFPFGVFSSDL